MDTEELKNTMKQLHLTNIYRALSPKIAAYKFFLNAPETFSRIDHMLGHKINLHKFIRSKIIESKFSVTVSNWTSITQRNLGNSQIHKNSATHS